VRQCIFVLRALVQITYICVVQNSLLREEGILHEEVDT